MAGICCTWENFGRPMTGCYLQSNTWDSWRQEGPRVTIMIALRGGLRNVYNLCYTCNNVSHIIHSMKLRYIYFKNAVFIIFSSHNYSTNKYCCHYTHTLWLATCNFLITQSLQEKIKLNYQKCCFLWVSSLLSRRFF